MINRRGERYLTLVSFPKLNRKVVERGKLHDHSLSCLGTGIATKRGGDKPFLKMFMYLEAILAEY